MGVFREPQRLETALFDRDGKLGWRDAVVRWNE
jgi:hypothetical protein